jgi:hypothetical protein
VLTAAAAVYLQEFRHSASATAAPAYHIYDQDHEVRHVRMNQQHRTPLTPPWYGDSVGHHQDDTLVIDTVGTKPAPLTSQSTVCRLENAPSKIETAQLMVALLDRFSKTVKPGGTKTFDIDDMSCAAYGGQQLAS